VLQWAHQRVIGTVRYKGSVVVVRIGVHLMPTSPTDANVTRACEQGPSWVQGRKVRAGNRLYSARSPDDMHARLAERTCMPLNRFGGTRLSAQPNAKAAPASPVAGKVRQECGLTRAPLLQPWRADLATCPNPCSVRAKSTRPMLRQGTSP
jgi:hypothetical protein